jgi:hypothetical protein
MLKKSKLLFLLTAMSIIVSCEKENETTSASTETVEFKNRSITPSFVKMGTGFSGVGVYTLVSSEDVIPKFQ